MYLSIALVLFKIIGATTFILLAWAAIDLFIRFITDKRASIGGVATVAAIGEWSYNQTFGRELIDYTDYTDNSEKSLCFLLVILVAFSFCIFWGPVIAIGVILGIGFGLRGIIRMHYQIRDKMRKIDAMKHDEHHVHEDTCI